MIEQGDSFNKNRGNSVEDIYVRQENINANEPVNLKTKFRTHVYIFERFHTFWIA